MTRSQATPCSSQLIWCEGRIAELERELEVARYWGPKWEKCHAELAAAQAREKVLRDALDEIGALNLAAKLSPVITTIVREALAQPANDTALKSALKAERERCAKACEKIMDREGNTAFECVNAVRALED